MISKSVAKTIAIEQICDLVMAQIECGWADDYFLDDELHESQEDINIIAAEAAKIVKTLEKQAANRRLKMQLKKK